MKFSWKNIRPAVLISLGLTMILMSVAWAMDPLAPAAGTPAPAPVQVTQPDSTAVQASASAPIQVTQPDPTATQATLAPVPAAATTTLTPLPAVTTTASSPAPTSQLAVIPLTSTAPLASTDNGSTGLPSSGATSTAANADTEIVETEITEEVASPTQPGKKIKRRRKVRRRVKKGRGKKSAKVRGIKYPHRIKSKKGVAGSTMTMGKNPSQMTPQQRQRWEIARRNRLVQAQRKRALMRIQKTPQSNLAKMRARQVQLLPQKKKKYGSRKTIGMTPRKKNAKSTGQGAQTAQPDAAVDDSSQASTGVTTDDGSTDATIDTTTDSQSTDASTGS